MSKCDEKSCLAHNIGSPVDSSADECAEEQAPANTVVFHALELKGLLV